MGILIDAGADYSAATKSRSTISVYGITALMKAALEGTYRDHFKALLTAGANPDATDNLGATALARAAIHGHSAAVEILLEAGAKPDLADQFGSTATDEGRRKRPCRCDAVAHRSWRKSKRNESHRRNAADVDHASRAYRRRKTSARSRRRSQCVRLNGETALMRAAFDGHDDLAELLLQAGADLYATNLHGDTAMSLAVNKGHRRIAAILCDLERTNKLKLDETK